MFYRDEKLAIFIDGPNTHAAARALGFDIDYKRLRQEFAGRARLVRIYYFTAVYEGDEYSSVRPLVDWLAYNGFTVMTKPTKEFTDATGRSKTKGNMGIDLTVTAIELAPLVDHIVLLSGDGDFRPLVDYLQRKGVRVSVVSTTRSQTALIADDLRRQCDTFIDLDSLKDSIERTPLEED